VCVIVDCAAMTSAGAPSSPMSANNSLSKGDGRDWSSFTYTALHSSFYSDQQDAFSFSFTTPAGKIYAKIVSYHSYCLIVVCRIKSRMSFFGWTDTSPIAKSHSTTASATTSSSAIAERPRDALCPSVVNLNKIIYIHFYLP